MQPITHYAHLSANGSTLLQTGRTQLSCVVINTVGASSNTLTLYDDVNAADSTHIVAIINTATAMGSLIYDVNLRRGLYAVLASGTAADVTIGYA